MKEGIHNPSTNMICISGVFNVFSSLSIKPDVMMYSILYITLIKLFPMLIYDV